MLNKCWKVLSYFFLPGSKLPGGLSPWRGGPGWRRERICFHPSRLVLPVAFVPLPGTTQARILTTSFLPPRPRSNCPAVTHPLGPPCWTSTGSLNPIQALSMLSSIKAFGRCHLFPMCFPGGSDGIESTRSAGDPGSIPGLRRSPEKETATHSSIPWTEEPGGL